MKENLRIIMNLTWQFVKKNGYNLSKALKVAWMNFKLKARMAKGIVKFYFMKVDGSIREAYGTLAESLIPTTAGCDRRNNTSIQTYFDTERDAWRCYKLANLIHIS